MAKHTRILLIEADRGDAETIREYLDTSACPCDVSIVPRVQDGLQLIDDSLIDMVMLDLSVPDSSGLQGLHRLRARAPEIPIIILTGLPDIAAAERAVRSGAQDCLVKEQLDANLLAHAVQYAHLRQAFRMELEEMSLRDPLTGVYNRRGFRLLAEQSLRLARRNGRDSVLLLADMNDLKDINDTHGHAQGDLALQATARSFRSALRDSDIIGRLGGDEFVALAVEAHPPGIFSLISRLEAQLAAESERLDMILPLSLSIGIAPFDPKESPPLTDLIMTADRDMYEKKRAYRKARDEG